MDKIVAIESGPRSARDTLGVETDFEMLFFALLSLGEGLVNPAWWHGLGATNSYRFLAARRSLATSSAVVLPASGWRLMLSSSQR